MQLAGEGSNSQAILDLAAIAVKHFKAMLNSLERADSTTPARLPRWGPRLSALWPWRRVAMWNKPGRYPLPVLML
jgi:hypothetical protein